LPTPLPSPIATPKALGEHLALEAARKGSPFQPYFDSMPMLREPHNTLSWESFPLDYLHLLQAQPLVRVRGAVAGPARG
jgi:hypothetical protein